MKLEEIGEFGFIARIQKDCIVRPAGVIRGIGDDCCVIRSSGGQAILLTTDMLVERVHFLLDRVTPYSLGRKSLAVNLSDIAAMGGRPREAVVSIAAPVEIEVSDLDALYDGMKSIAAEHDVNLLGGDTTSSPGPLVVNVALMGEAREDEVLYRSGAQAGDRIFLTGCVGSSAAGLDLILRNGESQGYERLHEAHCDPRPHVREGRVIAATRLAHSLIDVSDGVASDLGHVCEMSRVGAVIEEARIPTDAVFDDYCVRNACDRRRLMMHVGEDYVLLGSVPRESAPELERALAGQGCAFHVIGEITPKPGLLLERRDGTTAALTARGYDHFRKEEGR